eukprot:scaffold9484_cov124-Isochrysis_galbana.AAC.13
MYTIPPPPHSPHSPLNTASHQPGTGTSARLTLTAQPRLVTTRGRGLASACISIMLDGADAGTLWPAETGGPMALPPLSLCALTGGAMVWVGRWGWQAGRWGWQAERRCRQPTPPPCALAGGAMWWRARRRWRAGG